MDKEGQSYKNGDLQRLHERIDNLDEKIESKFSKISEHQIKMAVALGSIETTLKLQPPQPVRPCKELADHLTSHAELRRLWQRPVVGMLIHLLELGLVALITFFISYGVLVKLK